jgi:hypothetical protein
MAVVELDTSTIDIFSGLYETVGNSFNSNGDLSFGQGLSTSQIIAISNITMLMLVDTPDYISSGLYSTCLHYTYRWRYLDSSEKEVSDSSEPANAMKLSALDSGPYDLTTTRLQCNKSKLYDYRELLTEHFEVLANMIFSSSVNQSESSYEIWRKTKEDLLGPVPILLIFLSSAQVPFLVATFLYYRLKKDEAKKKTVKIMENVMAVFSVIFLIAAAFCSITTTTVLKEYRSKIHEELSNFKIVLHFGKTWFALLWTVFYSSFLTMTCWTMPVWFKTPPKRTEEDDSAVLGSNDTDRLFQSHSYGNEIHDDDTSMEMSSFPRRSFNYYFADHGDSTKSLSDESAVLIDVPFKNQD